VLPSRDRQRVAGAARASGYTLFGHLFAALVEALEPSTGDAPLAVAVPMSEGHRAGAADLVGNLTDLVIVPFAPRPGEPRAARRTRAADAVGHALSRPPLPLLGLLDALEAAGRPAQAPELLLNLEPIRRLPSVPGLQLSVVDMPRPAVRFALAVHVLDDGETLRVDVDHRTDRIDADSAAAFVDRFLWAAGENT
jgi:hypothetical protein